MHFQWNRYYLDNEEEDSEPLSYQFELNGFQTKQLIKNLGSTLIWMQLIIVSYVVYPVIYLLGKRIKM